MSLMQPLDDEVWPPSLASLLESKTFAERLRYMAYRRLGRTDETEVFEAVSDVVVRALQEGPDRFLQRFASSISLIRYILVVIRNRRIKEAMRQHKETWLSESDWPGVEKDVRSLIEESQVAYLKELVDGTDHDDTLLTPIERQIVCLKMEGKTFSEIAHELKWKTPKGWAVSKTHRIYDGAIRKLRVWFFA